MEKITGKNNDLVKNIKKLLTSSKERKAQGLFVLEGARLVFDVLNSFYEVKYFVSTPHGFEKYQPKCEKMIEKAEKSFLISDEIAAKLGDTQNPQGIFAVCKMKHDKHTDISDNSKQIALDNVQDPSNLGAIVRTAEALGIDRVIVGGGCDIFNPKALRSSMGSMLRVNLLRTDNLTEFLSEQNAKGIAVYGTSPDKNVTPITDVDFSNGCICVIGNEANGISDSVKNVCSELVTIRMLGNAESLNASVAASIAMWEMLR